MDDKQIIDQYFDRSQHAAEAAREKYGAHCCAIAYNILESEEEAETCADGVWPLAWEAMPPHRPSRLSSFLGGITRRLALDRWSKRSLKQRTAQAAPCVFGTQVERYNFARATVFSEA